MKKVLIIIVAILVVAVIISVSAFSPVVDTYESEFYDDGTWGTEIYVGYEDGTEQKIQFTDNPILKAFALKTLSGFVITYFKFKFVVKVTDMGGFNSVQVKGNDMIVKTIICHGIDLSAQMHVIPNTITNVVTVNSEDVWVDVAELVISASDVESHISGYGIYSIWWMSDTSSPKPQYKGDSVSDWATGEYPPVRMLIFSRESSTAQMVVDSVQPLSGSLGGGSV